MTRICPSCGQTVAPAPRNSSMAPVRLGIPVGLVPAAISALAIARNAAMMSSSPEGQIGMEALRQELVQHLPAPAGAFHSYHWLSICNAIMENGSFRAAPVNRGSAYRPAWHVELHSGETQAISREQTDETAAMALCQDLTDLLAQICW